MFNQNFMKNHMNILQIIFVLLIFGCCLVFYHQYYNVNQSSTDDVVEKFTEISKKNETSKIDKIKNKILRIKFDIEKIEKRLNSSIYFLDSLKTPHNEKDEDINEKDKDINEKDKDINEKDEDINEEDEDINEEDENNNEEDEDNNGKNQVSDPSGSEVDDQESNDNDKADTVVRMQENVVESFTNFVDEPKKKHTHRKEDTFQVQGISCGLTANCYQY